MQYPAYAVHAARHCRTQHACIAAAVAQRCEIKCCSYALLNECVVNHRVTFVLHCCRAALISENISGFLRTVAVLYCSSAQGLPAVIRQ
jgi:hypothetical protein